MENNKCFLPHKMMLTSGHETGLIDGEEWDQISYLKGWKSEAVELYNLIGIPASYLLDAEEKIVAKNLRGAELEKKVR